MTRICEKCQVPLLVIKATTGIIGWNSTNYKRTNKPSNPILLYKCPKCGRLEDGFSMRVRITDEMS